jgi:hypothetical protein
VTASTTTLAPPLPRSLLAPGPNAPPDLPTATAVVAESLRLDLDTQPTALDQGALNLWFRDNLHPAWVQLGALEEAERLVQDRTEDNPWLTVCCAHDFGDNVYVDSTFEVLGHDPARMYVCGDVDNSDDTWFWSSWPSPHLTPGPVGTVGPRWYWAEIYEAQIQTLDDALAQLKPALRILGKTEEAAPGYLWRDRIHDHSPLTHIRNPKSRD